MKKMENSQIGRRIAEARETKGWSQDQLAAALDPPVTRAAISQWESGSTGFTTEKLTRLAKALGLDEEWLRTGRGKTAPQVRSEPLSREHWRMALILAETFSEQLRKQGQEPLSPDQKMDLAEKIGPDIASYLEKP